MEAEFRELEAAGIICRSDSPWSSPLHMVRKKDGSWRPFGDYRRLNLAMTHDRYPLPSILDLSNKLHSCKFFSCIDLVKGYHQIPMAAQDIAKTAIITPFGLFATSSCPSASAMPPRPSSASWTAYSSTSPSCSPTWTTSSSPATAWRSTSYTSGRSSPSFRRTGLQINPAKCVIAATVEFLGHRVDQDDVRPLQWHIQAISDSPPPPQDVKQLQQFLGMVNFYRRFLPGIARTL